MEKKPYTGGCACGKFRYHIDAMPMLMGKCHCRDCQKWTGCAYKPFAVFPIEALEQEGQIRFYEKTADSGYKVSRGFCPQCGGEGLAKSEKFPHLLVISAGTLDSVEGFEPTIEIYTDSAQKWNMMSKLTKKYVAGLN